MFSWNFRWTVFFKTEDLNITKHLVTATVSERSWRKLSLYIVRWLYSALLFFGVYEIYKKNHSFSTVYSRGKILFFSSPKLPILFIQKQMTAVGLGQQRAQAVGLRFESLSCQKFLRFNPNKFRYPQLVKYYKGSPTKIFDTVRQKISTENCDITLWSIKTFDTLNSWHPKSSPYENFRHCETRNFRRNNLTLRLFPPPSHTSFLDTRI